MIELVMYGMIPSAKTETCVSAPPEKRLISPRMLLLLDAFTSSEASTTGTGTNDPNR
jgi:hypothetical protein